MKHILTILSLIFLGVAVFNLAQPVADLSTIRLSLGIIGAIYLIVSILKGKLKTTG